MAPLLSAEEIAAIQADWAKHSSVPLMGQVLSQAFQDNPSLRHAFPFLKGHEDVDLEAMQQMDGFKKHEKLLANFFGDAIATLGEGTEQKFHDLGKRHIALHVTAEQLGFVAVAMLKVLEAAGAQMDAWNLFGKHITVNMVEGLQG